jgi:hypothetical protein
MMFMSAKNQTGEAIGGGKGLFPIRGLPAVPGSGEPHSLGSPNPDS